MKTMRHKRESQPALDEVLRTSSWLDSDDDPDGKLDRFLETADEDMILQLVAAGEKPHSDGAALQACYEQRQAAATTVVARKPFEVWAGPSTPNRVVGVARSKHSHSSSTMRTQPSARPAVAKSAKRISWCKPVLWLLIAAACFGIAAFNNDGGTPAASSSPTVVDTSHLSNQKLPAKNTGKYLTCDIRDLPVAVWILADNPETEGNLGFDYSELNPSELRILRLRMLKPDGGLLHIDKLEFFNWLDSEQIAVGSSMHLEYTELGISGPAEVLQVRLCPRIPPRPSPNHCLVTSKFAHDASNVLDLYIEGLDEPIGVTANHPVWSEDRQGYVQAGNLCWGEWLLTAQKNIASVKQLSPRSTTEPVYNLEVDGEHVYYVSPSGILIHNAKNYVNAGIVERYGDVVEIMARGKNGTIEIISDMRRQGDRLIFERLHIQGAGAMTSSIGELRGIARSILRQEGAKEAVIRGATRSTGRRIGHLPREIIIRLD